MQRYALEVARRLGDYIRPLYPTKPLLGAKGHLWEQLYLPALVGKRLLFSPNNTGPLAIRHQVCTIHDLIPLDHPEWFNRRFACWYEWLLPKLARNVTRLIAVSEFTKARIVERLRVKPEKVAVIPNGIDERFSPCGAEEIEAVRSALRIKTRYMLCVGSVEPRKNLIRLLQAWSRVPAAKSEDVVLVIAGGLGTARVFEAVSLGKVPARVKFTGYVPDKQLPALYSGALALIYPSLYEGFGLPPLEAMACGTPVVTSNNTSLPEVVGDAAVLVNPEDVDSIASGIQEILSSADLRRELQEQGLQRARQITWQRAAEQTLQLLQEQTNA
jgi:glycosyltransferase involved in cell wall biosynthesis